MIRARGADDRGWALRLAMGVVFILVAAWIGSLLGLAQWLNSGNVATLDRAVSTWLHIHVAPGAMGAMTVISAIHGTLGMTLMTGGLMACMLWMQDPRWLAMLACVGLGRLNNVFVKLIIDRERPAWAWQSGALPESLSFPSGHTLGACLFYGFIAWWLAKRIGSPIKTTCLYAGAAFMVALVATSRIVLGVHYPSDCVGAVIEALAWLAICLMPLTRHSSDGRQGPDARGPSSP